MTRRSVTHQLVASHLAGGRMQPGDEIGLRIDQTLTQDATGTVVMLALEAMGLERTQADVSAQYVDHNLLQEDHKNPDDHLFLYTAARRWGLYFSRAGGGVSHPVHMMRLGVPGKTLIGSDSHTPAAGALGMLALGAGGLDVATAIAGYPVYLDMPEVWGIEITGALPPWVSAKDVILEMLRRHGVSGGLGRVLEYHGPGLAGLSAMDRHVIANMGTELGATSTVFPSDERTREFLEAHGRGDAWTAIAADDGADYDHRETIDLGALEPLIALPSSPGKVVPVREVAGRPIYQAYLGSSANPGFRDFAVPARMVRGRRVADAVSFDVNPTSRQVLADLSRSGDLAALISAGARIHQAGCNGCIGMGQAPATGRISLRTVPRNFPGRSGTREDAVYLCSPETATASALTGRITDPRDLDIAWPGADVVDRPAAHEEMLIPPLPPQRAGDVELVKGPNIDEMPRLDRPPARLEVPVILTVGDDVSTDEILPAGARVLPFRSNIPAIAEFSFEGVCDDYPARARDAGDRGHAVAGGANYGQGSSREHAALAPRYLGLRVVLAESFARIHYQNLINFGVLPLVFADAHDHTRVAEGDTLVVEDVAGLVTGRGGEVAIGGESIAVRAPMSTRQAEVFEAGGLVSWLATA